MLKKFFKKIAGFFLYVFYLMAATLAIIYVVFWLPYIKKIESREKPSAISPEVMNNISEETVRRVGFITKERFSAFYMKTFDKAAGSIRVCALGDSFTYGDEVDNGNDYPAILQQLFTERGYKNVEVVNFGNSFHGLGQAFILWQEVAKPMGCDFALLGPQTLFPARDSYFNHTDDSSPYYLHSLYHFGKSDELVRVDVAGETHRERFEDYYSFIPKWKYLRYESRVPAIARSMIPEGKEVRNPFYYSDLSSDEHVWKLWSRLLMEFSSSESVQVVMLVAEEFYFNYFRDHMNMPANLAMDRYIQDGSFPHRAPNRHHSGFGNRLLAERYFAQLTGEQVHSSRLETSADSRFGQPGVCSRPAAGIPEKQNLSALAIKEGDGLVGYLYRASSSSAGTRLGKVDFPALSYQSILAIVGEEESLGQAAYMFLPDKLQGGEAVYLKVGEQRYPIGQVVRESGELDIFSVRLPGFSLNYYDLPYLAEKNYPMLAEQADAPYSLWIGDTMFYHGTKKLDDLFGLEPLQDNQYRFVAHANAYGYLSTRPTSGHLDLVWEYRNGETVSEVRCPFLTYTHRPVDYRPFAPEKYLIRKTTDGIASIYSR